MKKRLKMQPVLLAALCMSLTAASVSGAEFTDGGVSAFSDAESQTEQEAEVSAADTEEGQESKVSVTGGEETEQETEITAPEAEQNNGEDTFISGENEAPVAEVETQDSAQANPVPTARVIKNDIIYEYVPETDTYKVTGTQYGYLSTYSVNRTVEGRTVTQIGEKAFVNVSDLKKVVISDNITAISEDAFGDATGLTIQAPENTVACEFAKKAGFTWEPLTVREIGQMQVRMIYTEREFYMEWDPIEEAEEYEIYLYNPDKGKYELKGTTRYSKYTLGYYEKFSQDHYYKIRAYSNSGIYKEAYGEFCDVTAKAVPGRPDMKAIEKKDNGLQISWSSAENAEGYAVYRSEARKGPWVEAGKVTGGDQTTYLDRDADMEKTYYYKVKAFCTVDNGFYYGDESSPMITDESFAYIYLPETDSYKIVGTWDVKEITIPAFYNGKEITEIADKAFYGFDDVEKICINNRSRITIGESAFENCSNLRSVSVSGEAKIKRRAFYNCPKLAEYGTIGNVGNDTVIEQDSFDPDTKMIINGGEYGWDESVIRFINEHQILTEVPDTDGNYSSYSKGITYMYSEYENSEVCVDFDNSRTAVQVENGTGVIGRKAFYDCTNVTKVLLPGSLKKIDSQAFAWCRSMTISIPKSVTSISKDAFLNASDITIRAPKGSYAEKYAKKHGITCKTWNVEQVKAPKLTYYYDKNGYAVLKWSKVEYADVYKIYLYNTETKKYKLLHTENKNKLTFLPYLGRGTKRTFKIKAYSSSGVYEKDNSPFSAPVTVQELPGDCRITTASRSQKGITIKWTTSDGAAGYIVRRNGVKIATVSKANIRQYTDTKVKKDAAYYYSIQPYGVTKEGIWLYGRTSSEKFSGY